MKCLECVINPLIHTFSGGAEVSSKLLPLVCVKCRVFSKQQLILTIFERPPNLKGVACLRNKLNYTHTNVGAKVQPHELSVLIVYPTQLLKYVRFV